MAGLAIWGSRAANRVPLYIATAELTIVPPVGHPPSDIEGGCWGMQTYQDYIQRSIFRNTSKAQFSPAELQLILDSASAGLSSDLWRNLSCEWPVQTRILRISAQHPNPKAAELMANRYTALAIADFVEGERESNRPLNLADLLPMFGNANAREDLEALVQAQNRLRASGAVTIHFKQSQIAVARKITVHQSSLFRPLQPAL